MPGLVLPHGALQRLEWRQGWSERVTAEHAIVPEVAEASQVATGIDEEEEEIELESQELEPADFGLDDSNRASQPTAPPRSVEDHSLDQTGELELFEVEHVDSGPLRLSSSDVELAANGEPEITESQSAKIAPPPTPNSPRNSGLQRLEAAPRAAANEVDSLMSEILEAESTLALRERKTTSDWWDEIFDDSFLRMASPVRTRTEREVAFLVGSLAPVDGARILDVGCGIGRHAIELASRGMSVIGVDKSRTFLSRGLEDASARDLDVKFLLGDMRELDFQSEFDGVYCVNTTFGYFDDSTNYDVLRRMVRALKPGARLLIDQSNRDHVITQCPRRTWWEADDIVVMDDVKFDYLGSLLKIERSLVDGDSPPWEQHISIRLYTTHELCQMMEALGLEVLGVSGDIATPGVYFGPESRNNIVTGRKPIAE
ncbi:MAG: SAM-dependent methyltransferase [Bradymonadia bacterium]